MEHMLTPIEAKMLVTGRYLQTIKAIRERLRIGLADAKEYVDSCLNQMGFLERQPCETCQGSGYGQGHQKNSEYLKIMREHERGIA